MNRSRVLVLLSLAGCSTSSTTPANGADASIDSDATVDATVDAATNDAASDGAIEATAEGGNRSCVVRPACLGCYGDGGVCCVHPNPSPPPEYATTCAACPADAGPSSLTLACGDGADCPGAQVCCVQKDTSGNVGSFCAASCDATQRQYGLCDTNAATTKCPTTAPCSKTNIDAWNLPHCYGTCGGVAPPP